MSIWSKIKHAILGDDPKAFKRFVKNHEFNSGRGREPFRSATKKYAHHKYRHAKRPAGSKALRRALRRRWKEYSVKQRGRFASYWNAAQEKRKK